MPNAHEAARHDVEEKASKEFVGVQRHDLHAVVIGIVLPPKPDTTVAEIHEPIIREGDAVGIASEVGEHLLGTGEGPLRVHDPVDGSELTEQAGEGVAIGQIGGAPAKVSLPASNARCRPARYFARKTVDSARTGNRKDDRPAIHRERSRGQGAAGDQTVQMEMLREILSPRVQNRGDADRAAKVPRVTTEGEQGVGGRAKEQRVDHPRIALGERVEIVRQREDDVEVRNRQQVGPARGEPPFLGERLALGAMPIAARVVGDPHGAAPVTRLPMPAEGGGAAGRNRPERHVLDRREAVR